MLLMLYATPASSSIKYLKPISSNNASTILGEGAMITPITRSFNLE